MYLDLRQGEGKNFSIKLSAAAAEDKQQGKTFVLLMKFSLLTFPSYWNNNGEGVLMIVYTVCQGK